VLHLIWCWPDNTFPKIKSRQRVAISSGERTKADLEAIKDSQLQDIIKRTKFVAVALHIALNHIGTN
jgi:hypothetical protein